MDTLSAINQIKEQINRSSDPQEVCRLRRKLKELQYLQIWQMETLERMFD
jgi:hypothetical protein